MDKERIWNLIAKKLAGEASPDDLKELESVLRLEPDLHYSLEALQDIWKKHEEADETLGELAFQRHMDRMQSMGIDMPTRERESSIDEFQEAANPIRKKKILVFTITCFLLVFCSYYFFNNRNPFAPALKPVTEVVTQNGSRTDISLPDGSTVWLNAGSTLTYDSLYGNKLREVTLSGEGYFDVVRNPNKPFIIHTGKINIRVLGTIFNVKSYPGEGTIETSLIKGSIEVSFLSMPSKKIILKPDQKLVIDKEELNGGSSAGQAKVQTQMITIQPLRHIENDSSLAETGWMQNRLYFNDMSFHELLKSMERKYGVSFQMSDDALDTIHFTGSFQDETVIQALDALRLTAAQSSYDFNYEMQGNQVFIYNSNKNNHSIQPK